MATAADITKRTGPGRWRLAIAALVVVAATAGIAWLWLDPRVEVMHRNFGTLAVSLLVYLGLSLWVLALSGWSWWRRLVLVALPIVVYKATVRQLSFTGDMVPVVEFFWDPTFAERLAAHATAPAELPAVDASVRLTDFPEYRGRNRDGVVVGPLLERDWQVHPPKLLWRRPVGGGYASIAVAGNLAVTIEQRGDDEAVVAYDTATGNERWVHRYPAHFKEVLGGPGPRATPTIADGLVYALGATGRLTCLEAATGQLRWETDILQDSENLRWGMTASPLVYDEVVVVNPGRQPPTASAAALLALNRKTGAAVWKSGQHRAGYSSPMLVTLAGRRQVLLFDGEGVAGYDAADGTELWRYPWLTQEFINVAQPIVLPGDRLFISSGYGVGCNLLQVRQHDGKWEVSPLWGNGSNLRALRCKFTSPVHYQGHIYGLDENGGLLTCLDAQTGQLRWKEGRYGHGQVLLTQGLLLICSEKGQLALVEATPEGHRELGRFQALTPNPKNWNQHALANGRVYVRNHEEMACYDLRAP
ncbi:MAG: PQQ-like beta-propeller repeat protein [Gemmataceae bacterium]|nr:PQQ-like beta-propeller repeat protein [Gemmataceae bacterium]MDW8264633.1 PQQ-binding-like beta-propeller repeat protein [Gemmataceae bacterium]